MAVVIKVDFAKLDKLISDARLRWEELQKENLTPEEQIERADLKNFFFAENYGSTRPIREYM